MLRTILSDKAPTDISCGKKLQFRKPAAAAQSESEPPRGVVVGQRNEINHEGRYDGERGRERAHFFSSPCFPRVSGWGNVES